MEIQFAPWRMHYIQSTVKPKQEGCVLCAIHQADPDNDPRNLVLHRAEFCYVVLNLYPYNTGHVMVVPYAHTADLAGLDDACADELFALTRRCAAFLQQEYQPHGMNLGMNLGETAGAGIAAHLHMHLVPRWGGDTNFMPLVGGARIIPEDLDQTYQRLQPYFGSVHG